MYTLQDAEDLFIVLEPLLGGDIRYERHHANEWNHKSKIIANDLARQNITTAGTSDNPRQTIPKLLLC